jgi:hypothetical protein
MRSIDLSSNFFKSSKQSPKWILLVLITYESYFFFDSIVVGDNTSVDN